MKKYLLPENGTFYKANLHCHSTYSDGAYTPEELKELYKSNGYSVLAYTDHDIMIPHHELRDESFLPLVGYEMEITEHKADFSHAKTCHMCLISLEENPKEQVCYHRSKYLFGNAESHRAELRFDETKPDFEREYNGECISEMFQAGREHGFFVTYNHPCWSREDYTDYSNYHNMNAMEIVNFGCVAMGYDDHNGRVYDDMLNLGKRIYCLATDDNHNREPRESLKFDSCGGYVMIKAPQLQYREITRALENGEFYSSEAPSIHALWVEDGAVHIETSPARHIMYMAGCRCGQVSEDGGRPVTSGVFPINPNDQWFRIEVTDEHGYKAYTNAYFVDEIL